MKRRGEFYIVRWLIFYFAFFLILGTIIGSCSKNSSNSSNYIDKRELYHKKKHYNKFHCDEVTYKKVICPKCNGVGEVEFSTAGKVMFGIVTFGFGCLTNPTDRCETCYGTGYIEVPDI